MPDHIWSLEALKEYLDTRFEASDKRMDEFKAEYSTHHDDLVKELNAVRTILSGMTAGDTTSQRLTATVIAVVALVVTGATAIAVFVIH